MVRVVIFGQGYVVSIFVSGFEKIKVGKMEFYGVLLVDEFLIKIKDIEIVGLYDVDFNKVGKDFYEVVKSYDFDVLESFRGIIIRKGVYFGSFRNFLFIFIGFDDEMMFKEVVDYFVNEWKEFKFDVFVNVCIIEVFVLFESREEFEKVIEENNKERFIVIQFYVYVVVKYVKEVGGVVFVNVILIFIVNDLVFVEFVKESNLVIFGDDGVIGVILFIVDIFSYFVQRNCYVFDIVQFNIGGNQDFLVLIDEERNRSKEFIKSLVVEDLFGYNVLYYIKLIGFFELFGDKKFIVMYIEYVSFNGVYDEFVIIGRINDSFVFVGLFVDFVRFGKIVIEKKEFGIVYEVNVFYMKNFGFKEVRNILRIIVYEKMRMWVGLKFRWFNWI